MEELKRDTSKEFVTKVEKLYSGEIIKEFTDNEANLLNRLRSESGSLGDFVARLQNANFSEFKIGIVIGTLKWSIIFNRSLKAIVAESQRLGRMLTTDEAEEIIKNSEWDMK